jgi:hypothetical protein
MEVESNNYKSLYEVIKSKETDVWRIFIEMIIELNILMCKNIKIILDPNFILIDEKQNVKLNLID